jgi:hypothetical protein
MSERPDGNAIADWWGVIEDAFNARDEGEVSALVDRMDGWPTIIDVDEYVDNDDVQERFASEVARIERRQEEARTAGKVELATALGGLISMLSAT